MAVASASISRRIFFKSKGGTFSAIFMADSGDLFQFYTGDSPTASDSKYYPEISSAKPVKLVLTITSSSVTGVVNPASVTYIVAGQTLYFNSAGVCSSPTPARLQSKFRLNGGALEIIGGLCDIAGGSSFIIEAVATVDSGSGTDTVTAHLPVTIAQYRADGDNGIVTIQSPDGKNFTLEKDGDSCKLNARVFKDLQWLNDSEFTVEWYQLKTTGWEKLDETGKTLTVTDEMVDTYADFRVTAYQRGVAIGSDTQGVMDASDPYDIITSIAIYKGTGSVTATSDETITDDLPDSAYLEYTCSMVNRGETSALSGVTWSGVLVSASGLQLVTVSNNSSSNKMQVKKSDLIACGGVGEYSLMITATRQ